MPRPPSAQNAATRAVDELDDAQVRDALREHAPAFASSTRPRQALIGLIACFTPAPPRAVLCYVYGSVRKHVTMNVNVLGRTTAYWDRARARPGAPQAAEVAGLLADLESKIRRSPTGSMLVHDVRMPGPKARESKRFDGDEVGRASALLNGEVRCHDILRFLTPRARIEFGEPRLEQAPLSRDTQDWLHGHILGRCDRAADRVRKCPDDIMRELRWFLLDVRVPPSETYAELSAELWADMTGTETSAEDFQRQVRAHLQQGPAAEVKPFASLRAYMHGAGDERIRDLLNQAGFDCSGE